MSQHYYNKEGDLVDPWTPGAYPSPSTILDRIKSPEYDAMVGRMGQEAADELMESAAARGTRIHKACELWVTNGFDAAQATKDAELLVDDLQYFIGFVNWWEKYTPTLINAEMRVTSDKYQYTGTLDLALILDGDVWIVDLKTGMDSVRHGLQLKFYQQAYFEMKGKKARMGVLALDGKRACGYRNSRSPYGLKEFKEPLWAIVAHWNVHKWWSKKQPIKKPADVVEWKPSDGEEALNVKL